MDGQEILVYVFASTTFLFFVLFITIFAVLMCCVMRSTKKTASRNCVNCSPPKQAKDGARETTLIKDSDTAEDQDENSYAYLTVVRKNQYVTESKESYRRPKKVTGKENLVMILDTPELPQRQRTERNKQECQGRTGLHTTVYENGDDDDSDEDSRADKLYERYETMGSEDNIFSGSSFQNAMNCRKDDQAMVYDTLPPPRPVTPLIEANVPLTPDPVRKSEVIRANSQRGKGKGAKDTTGSSVRVERKATTTNLHVEKEVQGDSSSLTETETLKL